MAAATDKLTMKLLINQASKKVLFAEAGKDVVDFLFSLLTMQVGTITKLLIKDSMIGSIGNLYRSLEGLDEAYLHSDQAKSSFLKTNVSSSSLELILQQLPAPPKPTARRYYRCPQNQNCGHRLYFTYDNCRDYVSEVSGTKCPVCTEPMSREMKYVANKADETVVVNNGGGYVKGDFTYTIMDDLTVTPMSSTISSIILLDKFRVKDLNSLQEKTVTLGMEDALKLLKTSLQSKNVLTDTFMCKKKMSK